MFSNVYSQVYRGKAIATNFNDFVDWEGLLAGMPINARLLYYPTLPFSAQVLPLSLEKIRNLLRGYSPVFPGARKLWCRHLNASLSFFWHRGRARVC